MTEEKQVWKLYALHPDRRTEERLEQEERFYRITPDYLLLYRCFPPEDGIAVEGNDLMRLSAGDREWLRDCNLLLLAEENVRRSQETAKSLSRMVEALAGALEMQKKASSGGEPEQTEKTEAGKEGN